jgi:hypothetical protein
MKMRVMTRIARWFQRIFGPTPVPDSWVRCRVCNCLDLPSRMDRCNYGWACRGECSDQAWIDDSIF